MRRSLSRPAPGIGGWYQAIDFFRLDCWGSRGNDSILGWSQRLHIKCPHRIRAINQAQERFIRAMTSHEETLRVLNLTGSLAFDNDLDAIIWNFYIVKAIQCCKNPVTLSLPLLVKYTYRKFSRSGNSHHLRLIRHPLPIGAKNKPWQYSHILPI